MDLSRQKFAVFPKEIWELEYLEILKLEENRITVLPREINKLKNLKELYLNGNKLTIVPKEIWELKLKKKKNKRKILKENIRTLFAIGST
ncbi:leucine rich repeat protein [Leptospira interrogans serovar Bulgarica str. Mallika]|nr:leucine rich repeat protein [Leptospira interrogans serovar Bulgarica str. Mallika]